MQLLFEAYKREYRCYPVFHQVIKTDSNIKSLNKLRIILLYLMNDENIKKSYKCSIYS